MRGYLLAVLSGKKSGMYAFNAIHAKKLIAYAQH